MKVPQKLSVRVAALILVIAVVLVMAPRPGGRAYALEIKARAAVLMDYESGRIIFSQNPDVQLPPASVTKLMTMLLIAESIDSGRAKWDDLIRTSKNAAGMGGSQVYLREGEEMTLAEMTKAIAMVSANDASTAVAEYLYGSVELFIQKMNQRAQELGLKNTNFQNEHGLPDPKHYSSAHDLALIARELIRHPKILEWTSTWISYLRDGEFFLRNTNDLIQSYRGADGLKTGHTEEAGYCLCATAEVEGLRFISVIMGPRLIKCGLMSRRSCSTTVSAILRGRPSPRRVKNLGQSGCVEVIRRMFRLVPALIMQCWWNAAKKGSLKQSYCRRSRSSYRLKGANK